MKYRIVFLILAAVLLFCSCGETDLSEQDPSSEEQTSSVPDDGTVFKRELVSLGCSYKVDGTPHGDYSDDGMVLTDGFLGGMGAGWSISGGNITLDLGKDFSGLEELTVYLRGGNWGIEFPDECEYFISSDGKNWESVGKVGPEGLKDQPGSNGWAFRSFPLELTGEGLIARYVRARLTGAHMNYIWCQEFCVWRDSDLALPDPHVFNGTETINNLEYVNPGYMGDDDGPAYCVYSESGYNRSEMVFELSKAELNNIGTNGYSRVNGFVFLGSDVYDEDGEWMNCCDAGVYYSGVNRGWQLFAAVYDNGEGEYQWFDDPHTLNASSDYRLTLDCSKTDGRAKLTVTDVYDETVSYTLEFPLFGAKADGSRTGFLTNIAIDWAGEETFVDKEGVPTDDWLKVMDSCLGQGIYMKNVRIYGCALYKNGVRTDWDESLTDRRCLTPDSTYEGFEHKVITVKNATNDTEYIIDIDLGSDS